MNEHENEKNQDEESCSKKVQPTRKIEAVAESGSVELVAVEDKVRQHVEYVTNSAQKPQGFPMDEGDGAQSEELEDEGSAEEEWFRCPPQTTGSKQSEPCLQDGENVEESSLFESSEKKFKKEGN